MTVYRTCRLCTVEKDKCPHKAVIKGAIVGLGITSIKHKCNFYSPPFKPGQPVIARTYIDNEVGYDGDIENADFPAIFIKQVRTKALVLIKPGVSCIDGDAQFTPMKNKRGYCKLTFDKLKAREGVPFVEICENCEGPKNTPYDLKKCNVCGKEFHECDSVWAPETCDNCGPF